jgi:hypothetical protein
MDTKLVLSATWVVVMLIYLLGDVLRICSGDLAKSMADKNLNQFVWLGIAVLMLTPILMVFLNLVLPQSASRWANIIVAAFFFCSTWLACPPTDRYMTNSCWRSAWGSMGSRSGMHGIGRNPMLVYEFFLGSDGSLGLQPNCDCFQTCYASVIGGLK